MTRAKIIIIYFFGALERVLNGEILRVRSFSLKWFIYNLLSLILIAKTYILNFTLGIFFPLPYWQIFSSECISKYINKSCWKRRGCFGHVRIINREIKEINSGIKLAFTLLRFFLLVLIDIMFPSKQAIL